MCGIFGFVGEVECSGICIDGLEKLEYRGYDSAGLVGICEDGNFVCHKIVGKVDKLRKLCDQQKENKKISVAIAHTRWATHGAVNSINAHPHFDEKHDTAIVHNGIIENVGILKSMLKDRGVNFVSETDSEVIVQLIAKNYKGDFLAAVKESLNMLEGSFAIAIINKNHPEEIVVAAHESPLVLGIGNNAMFIASDPHAFCEHTRKVIFFENKEMATIRKNAYEIFNFSSKPIFKKTKYIDDEKCEYSKNCFAHHLLKEIYDQPQAIKNALFGRFLYDEGTAIFDSLLLQKSYLQKLKKIIILSCGSSLHAGYLGAYLIESQARMHVQVEISSEFRYKNGVIDDDTLAIAISQSGETADTLAAVRELKRKGAKILAISNIRESTLVRESDIFLSLKAGREISVAATKTFTSTFTVLSLFSLFLARMKHMDLYSGRKFLYQLQQLPIQIEDILKNVDEIESIAMKYHRYHQICFLGRLYMYPTAMEAALKLKEISYINANAYPAGEMKHGPIALIGAQCPTVALCANESVYDKMASNIMEIKARHGKVFAIASCHRQDLEDIVDDIFYIPRTIDELSPILVSVVCQLFAYFVAKNLGTEIDHPQNLAKTVTVE